jgi:hypothetical protein
MPSIYRSNRLGWHAFRKLFFKQESFMKAYQWTMLGLALDFLGIVVLSVEALRFFRGLSTAFEPPRVVIVDREEASEPQAVHGAFLPFTWWVIEHSLYGALLFLLLRLVLLPTGFDVWAWLVTPFHQLPFLGKVIATVVGFLILVLGVGELAHTIVRWAAGLPNIALTAMTSRVSSKTLGSIGFALICLGFLLQLYGTWVGRPTAILPAH